jgi:hypothetical protein
MGQGESVLTKESILENQLRDLVETTELLIKRISDHPSDNYLVQDGCMRLVYDNIIRFEAMKLDGSTELIGQFNIEMLDNVSWLNSIKFEYLADKKFMKDNPIVNKLLSVYIHCMLLDTLRKLRDADNEGTHLSLLFFLIEYQYRVSVDDFHAFASDYVNSVDSILGKLDNERDIALTIDSLSILMEKDPEVMNRHKAIGIKNIVLTKMGELSILDSYLSDEIKWLDGYIN